MSLLQVKSIIADQRRAEPVILSPSILVPAGPEAAPSPSAPPPPPPPRSSTGLSSTEIAFIASLLTILGLIASVFAVWKVLEMRKKWKTLSQKTAETEEHDAEAPLYRAPVTSPRGVGWTPQIRSITCSMPVEGSDKMRVARPMKRARSPPPTTYRKISSPFSDPTPKSAPPRTVTFSEKDNMSSPVTPRALAKGDSR
ncbi:hypothetical protein SCLCIDRAFT_1215369 [Scleroderma citrinum Foug A]|uniref:Uncharacterized protein n=1 Tax=Scleroderma citrinum Foug A TaxID=1036808 RepID=A0A0C3E1S1_9AGAM|nr:hypothetical protein SCLCIDRAFT_1215369 [Scleroderma citrinum Foug A]